MCSDIIRTEGLGKTFIGRHGAVEAVHDLHLSVAVGEIVALRGPAGSGKTTVARMLAGLLRPTAGRVWVAGRDPASAVAFARSLVGYVPQTGSAGAAGRVLDEFLHRGRFADLDAIEVKRRTDRLLEHWDLTDLAETDLGTLGNAQRRRLELAMALLHSPALVIVDEPGAGLAEHEHRALGKRLHHLRDQAGCTVVITTHDAAAVAADRVVDLPGSRVPARHPELDAAA